MDPVTQARVFEPFFTTKPIGKGAGLGLAQVYGFAQQIGGAVAIVSAPGEGTTVMMWLPRAPVQVDRGAPGVLTEQPGMSRLRVLVVDDDDVVRALGQEMLAELGHQVASAGSGALAMERMRQDEVFDLLIVDYAMPSMTGAQLAAEAIKLRPGLPVLFMTGYADTDILAPWIARGYGMLSKPFSGADLDRAVQQAMARPGQGSLRKSEDPASDTTPPRG